MSSQSEISDEEALRRALSRWARLGTDVARVEPLGNGLINRTFAVDAPGGAWVLQRVSPIFDPAIHDNIAAVTERLAARGIATPRLVPTDEGERCARLGEAGVWRLLTRVAGHSFDAVAEVGQARAAAALVARFHAALDDLPHRFVGLRAGVHDTARHLAALESALADETAHRLHPEVAPLGRAILEAAAALPPLPELPPRVCHGDLKLNNVLFAGPDGEAARAAVALVDLDTVGPMQLSHELGDALRSWCNPAGENAAAARFDLAICAAALEGYAAGLGRALTPDERHALLLGPEWISLELAARFAADALRERYFGWDPARFSSRGDHNLLRARGQYALHRAAVSSRGERERILAG